MSGPVPTQSNIQVVLRSFLLSILPAGVEVVQGQDNRVPEPKSPDFVVMWPLRRERIETNIDQYIDTRFVGEIAGTTLTVSSLTYGALEVGRTVFGVGVASGTKITAFLSGTGAEGTYEVNNSQTVTSEVMAAGVTAIMQPTKLTQQLDVHGPTSSDNAQVISTVFRDIYACDFFANSDFPSVSPLYTEDPRQVPFENDQQQIEYRYVVEAHLQADQVVELPQQFAESLVVGIISVEATYPP